MQSKGIYPILVMLSKNTNTPIELHSKPKQILIINIQTELKLPNRGINDCLNDGMLKPGYLLMLSIRVSIKSIEIKAPYWIISINWNRNSQKGSDLYVMCSILLCSPASKKLIHKFWSI